MTGSGDHRYMPDPAVSADAYDAPAPDDHRDADRSRPDACFALAEQASEDAGPAQLVLVPRRRAAD
jgi:hypothetical protein